MQKITYTITPAMLLIEPDGKSTPSGLPERKFLYCVVLYVKVAVTKTSGHFS